MKKLRIVGLAMAGAGLITEFVTGQSAGLLLAGIGLFLAAASQ